MTRFPNQLPDLPDGIRHFSNIPFSQLLPRCAAIVHHGGVGTLSQALKAGTPQIVRPYGFDQFDNAQRLTRLGVAEEISVKAYRADKITQLLKDVVSNPAMASQCTAVSRRLTQSDPIAATCDLLLSRT